MRAGLLRQRVVIESAVDTQDSTTGEPVRSWAALATVWASIEPLRVREALIANIVLSQADTRVRIRWAAALANLGTKSRVRWTGVDGRNEVIYDVVSVIEPKMKRQELELICKSGTNEG